MKVHTGKKTQKEIEKIKVVRLDRDEYNLLNVIVAKKLWRQRSTWKLTQKWNTGRNWINCSCEIRERRRQHF